ncbi:TOMM precursor leader peptide-binding protein [Amycolatopsis sp. VS8301801F10]|uniref:TOMM precursor leader peptide-binding protein n=1 Tax=Amycolatopsis sp. VS8301801F10 TaxID=2652442 RepID=UPI0038FCF9E5
MHSVSHTAPDGTRVRLFSDGGFGTRLLAALGGPTGGAEQILVGVAENGDRGVLDFVAHQAKSRDLPWLPLVLDGASLRCGPTTGRGGGPCPDCVERRRRQHSREARLAALLPPPGEAAFLPEHVDVAAALVHRAVREFVHFGQSDAVYAADLVHGSFERHRAIPVHACPRCDPPRPDGSTWRFLAAALHSNAGAVG